MTDAFSVLTSLLDDRRTCRQFLPDEIPPADMERLLALAQRSPSWCNTQPWRVEVTRGAATADLRTALLEHVLASPQAPDFAYPAAYTGVYDERRKECGFQLYDSLGIERSDRDARFVQMLRNFELFDAPHVAVVHTDADLGVYGAIDCGLWVQSFLLGAQALGLAAAPQAALAAYSPFLREWYGLGDDRRVVVAISFGYADPTHPVNGFRTSRAELSDAITFHG